MFNLNSIKLSKKIERVLLGTAPSTKIYHNNSEIVADDNNDDNNTEDVIKKNNNKEIKSINKKKLNDSKLPYTEVVENSSMINKKVSFNI